MVLSLKRWKSRSSPGIEACAPVSTTHSLCLVGLRRRRSHPRPWLPRRQGAAASRPCGARRSACKPDPQPLGGAGWSSPVARQAHNLKVVGSNPTPATKNSPVKSTTWRGFAFLGQTAPEAYRNQSGGYSRAEARGIAGRILLATTG